jgi:hypothetical protein
MINATRPYPVAVAFCFIVLLCLGAGLSSGQKSPRRARPKQSCNVGGIPFACPQGFKPVQLGAGRPLALFFDQEYGLGLFVAVAEPGSEAPTFVAELTREALAAFFPKESPGYVLKPVARPGRISKHEVGGSLAKGFNGSVAVILNYHRLRVRGKDIFVGYASEIGKGQEARDFFEGSGYAESMPGCNASVEVAHSLTGERINRRDPPCELRVLPPIN